MHREGGYAGVGWQRPDVVVGVLSVGEGHVGGRGTVGEACPWTG